MVHLLLTIFVDYNGYRLKQFNGFIFKLILIKMGGFVT